MADKIVIAYDPEFQPGSGVCSLMAWHGSLRDLLERDSKAMFKGEHISGVVVDETGVTLYFAEGPRR